MKHIKLGRVDPSIKKRIDVNLCETQTVWLIWYPFLKKFLLLFNYSCLHFLPIPPDILFFFLNGTFSYCCLSTDVSISLNTPLVPPISTTHHPSYPPLALSMFLDDTSPFSSLYPLPAPLWLLSVCYFNVSGYILFACFID